MMIQDQIPFLYKIAYKYTSESEVADDLVQETLYKALKNESSFKKGTNLRAWLSIILRNNFINEYRKKSRYTNTDDVTTYVGDKEKYKAGNAGISQMHLEYINNAITQLPDNLKQPFLYYFDGYSYEEISNMFKVPLGTVKSRIHHARKKLKKSLKHLKAA
ncbi:MAG: sigma-70 family RNA polymerase sigma factor [Saprospiraceae bacterium]|nr:sigma-70 family RNA polymerase sigma factor [Bacteroidia bacterium]NNE15900.1 sigma-70 family RNA polymerase sigma factor [Saprospiraceae bacterium]NNL92032.1 sigma-70 family RNA polymerase sigma factor [Saprospiraceae bacterium]